MKKIGTAIILAGGKSERMGFDKQLIKIKEQNLIDMIIDKLHKTFDEIIVVSNSKSIYKNRNVIAVEDEIKNIGPLGGLYVGLKKSESMYSYVVACDMPIINDNYIDYMIKILNNQNTTSAIITRFGQWIEPFNCFYSKKIVEKIEQHINNGERSINSLIKKLDVIYIEEKIARRFSPNWEMFYNINTEKELNSYIKKLMTSERNIRVYNGEIL